MYLFTAMEIVQPSQILRYFCSEFVVKGIEVWPPSGAMRKTPMVQECGARNVISHVLKEGTLK